MHATGAETLPDDVQPAPGVYVEKLPDPETRAILVAVSGVFAYVFTAGPEVWRITSLLTPLLERAHIPVWVYGAVLWIAVILQLIPGEPLARFFGYLLSAICFSTFFILIAFNTHFGTTNHGVTPLGVVMYAGFAALYWLSARRVIFVFGGQRKP